MRNTAASFFVMCALITFGSTAVGQTAWTDLPVTGGLTVQFEADALAGTSGSSVADWDATYWDGATQYQASQSNTAYQPELILDAWNGHNMVRFNSDGDWDTTASGDYAKQMFLTNYTPGISAPTTGGAADYGDITLFVVAQQMEANYNAGSNVRGIAGAGDVANGRSLIWMEQSVSNGNRAEVATTGNEYQMFGGEGSLKDSAHIMSGVLSYSYDPASTGSEYQTATACYLDGTNGLDTVFTDDNNPSNGVLKIGGESSVRCFGGAIAEVVVYEESLDDASRILVENYLASKYATTMTANDHFSGETGINGDTGLDFDAGVFGIGKTADGAASVLTSGMATGLAIEATSLEDGMWLLAGHNNATHGWTADDGGQRWNRVWCVDETYAASGDSSEIAATFDLDAAGFTYDPSKEYALIFKENYGDSWDIVSTEYAVDGDLITFEGIPLGDTQNGVVDGYVTLAIVPEPGSLAMMTILMLAGGLLVVAKKRFLC